MYCLKMAELSIGLHTEVSIHIVVWNVLYETLVAIQAFEIKVDKMGGA